MVRRSDFRINGSNIVSLAGRGRTQTKIIRGNLPVDASECLPGGPKHQGTYVDFEIGIGLCRKYGLAELEERLYSLKPALEGPILEVQQSQVMPPSEPFTTVPELPGSDLGSLQDFITEQRGIWERERTGTLPRGPISDVPVHADDTSEMDSVSDTPDSEASLTSHGPCSIQGNAQLQAEEVSSIRRGNTVALLRQSGTNIGDSLLEDPYPQSTSNLHYSAWDSQPQYSQLTEIKPNLKPGSWETASRYGSFTELC